MKERMALKHARVINETRRSLLAEDAKIADTFWHRARGLMGKDELPIGRGLVLMPCKSVHSMMMRFPIDVLQLARDGTVLRALTPLQPFRLGPIVWGGHCAIELPAGTVFRSGTRVGDRIVIEVAA